MKPRRSPQSIYQVLVEEVQEHIRRNLFAEKININQTIRRLRKEKGLTGVALCKGSGDLDPRTPTAVEKGRIINPSIKTLHSVARGLGVSVSELFRHAEMGIDRNLYLGSQKGAFQIDFPWRGIKAVSLTPFIKDFFCGKLILGARKKIDQTFLKRPLSLFISVVFGRFEITVESRQIKLREGENLFFNGILRHSFYNPLERESVMLFITAPSFL